MRTLLLLAFLLFAPSNVLNNDIADDVVVMQINAKWNKHHNIDLKELKGCKVEFGWLEDQPKNLQSQVKTVPIVVIFKNGTPVKQWNADLSFTLDVDLSEIQSVVNEVL